MQVGQKVRVLRLRDRVSTDIVNQIQQNPVGVITDYKMVDGSGVGVMVKFSDQLTTWFFEDELEPQA